MSRTVTFLAHPIHSQTLSPNNVRPDIEKKIQKSFAIRKTRATLTRLQDRQQAGSISESKQLTLHFES